MFDFNLTKQKNAQPLLQEIISQSNGTQAFLQNVLDYFVNTYSAVKGSIFIYDNVTREFTQKAAHGFPMFPKARIVLKIGEGIIGRALAERRTIYTESASSMRGYIRHHNFPDDDTQTYLAVPLLQGKERVGAILLLRPTGEPYLADEISAIRENVNDVVSAIQNASVPSRQTARCRSRSSCATRQALRSPGLRALRRRARSTATVLSPVRQQARPPSPRASRSAARLLPTPARSPSPAEAERRGKLWL